MTRRGWIDCVADGMRSLSGYWSVSFFHVEGEWSGSPAKNAAKSLSSQFSRSVGTRRGYCGVHQVRLLETPIRCRPGGGGTREAGGTVAESLVGRSSAQSRKHAPNSGSAERSTVVDKPEEC